MDSLDTESRQHGSRSSEYEHETRPKQRDNARDECPKTELVLVAPYDAHQAGGPRIVKALLFPLLKTNLPNHDLLKEKGVERGLIGTGAYVRAKGRERVSSKKELSAKVTRLGDANIGDRLYERFFCLLDQLSKWYREDLLRVGFLLGPGTIAHFSNRHRCAMTMAFVVSHNLHVLLGSFSVNAVPDPV